MDPRCTACGRELPDRADVCQVCGQSVPKPSWHALLLWGVLLVMFAAIWFTLAPSKRK
jgi:hypothetical protein